MPPIRCVGISKNCVAPLPVLEDRKSPGDALRQIDLGARLRITLLLFVRYALAMNDVPKRIRVRLRGNGMGEQPDAQR